MATLQDVVAAENRLRAAMAKREVIRREIENIERDMGEFGVNADCLEAAEKMLVELDKQIEERRAELDAVLEEAEAFES